MRLAGTLLGKELLSLPRRKRFYAVRVALVSICGLILLFGLAMSTHGLSTTAGLALFSSLSTTTLVGMLFMGVSAGSSVVMREKEDRTLGLLFLSDIRRWDFVLGKTGTALFSMVLAMLSVLPLYMLSVSLGGVQTAQIAGAYAVTLATVFMVTCAGVMGACIAETEKQLRGLLSALVVGYFLLLPFLVVMAFITRGKEPSEELMTILSPFVSMGMLLSGEDLVMPFLNAGTCVGLGLLCLYIGAWILPKRIMTRDTPPVAQRLKDRLRNMVAFRGLIRLPPITGNPVEWRDLNYYYAGLRGAWMKCGMTVLAIVTTVWIVMGVAMHKGTQFQLETWLAAPCVAIAVVTAAVVALTSIHECGQTFSREKKSRALEVLLTTSLTDGDIIWGKVRAIVRSMLPWIVALILSTLASLAIMGRHQSFWGEGLLVMFSVALEYISMVLGYSCLALWLSVKCRKNVAFPVAILAIFLYNTLGRFIVVAAVFGFGRSSGSSMVAADVIVHIFLGVFGLLMVFGRFRETALADADRA